MAFQVKLQPSLHVYFSFLSEDRKAYVSLHRRRRVIYSMVHRFASMRMTQHCIYIAITVITLCNIVDVEYNLTVFLCAYVAY